MALHCWVVDVVGKDVAFVIRMLMVQWTDSCLDLMRYKLDCRHPDPQRAITEE